MNLRLFVLLACFLAVALPTHAQMSQGRDHITFEKLAPLDADAGDTVKVVIKARIHKWWHTYGLTPTVGEDGLGPDASVITIGPKSDFRLAGKPKILKGASMHYDSVWGANIEELHGKIEIEVPVVVSQKAKKGLIKGSIIVGMQMCDTVSCIQFDEMPQKISFNVVNEYVGQITETHDTTSAPATTPKQIEASSGTATQDDKPVETEEVRREKSKGLLSFFLYAMGVGFLALLTPCVFPMIPITVSFFTKRHEKKKVTGVRDSSIFGLGIVSTFTAVGIIVSIITSGTGVQDLAANTWMNLGIGLLFLALAFNLFGAFEIQIPVSIMNKLNAKSQGDGVSSVWLMGLTFSLTSFTCTVPFVGTLLLSASTAKSAADYLYPAVGTLGFATAFALPFVVLSMFPALLVRLPRAGGWMNNMKVVMGFIEIAAAVKFISNADLAAAWGIMPREVFLSIWAGVCMLIVMYVLGLFEMKLDSKVEKVSAIRASFAVVFASLAVWFGAGILGSNVSSFLEALLPPENYQELIDKANGVSTASLGNSQGSIVNRKKVDEGEKLVWMEDLAKAKEVARTSNKPIFIDFTGFTCTNCRLMEKYVFPKSVVHERFKKFVLVQLYTDRKTEPYITNQNILKSYGTVANPLYVMLRPDGSFIAQSGYLSKYQSDPNNFAEFLNTALN